MENTIGLMYLAEQTSPDDYKIKNLEIKQALGAVYACFEATLHSFDVLNRNRRMYDGDNVWNCITSSDRIQDSLRKRGWGGERDHPGQTTENAKLTAERVQRVEMSNTSHMIIAPRREGNLIISPIETWTGSEAGLGMGRAVAQGLIPSFSCRSIACMKFRGSKPYVEVKKVITYDWVWYPSHKEAEMRGSATFQIGPNERILLESCYEGLDTPINESQDMFVPITQFTDFREIITELDPNMNLLTESGMYDSTDITGFDPKTNNIIVERSGEKLFVNTSVDVKKKVEDFLSSF